jgi:transposase
MPRPYSIDLRQRVLICIKQGKKYPEIADILRVSLSTVKRYARIYKKTGDVKPRQEIKTGRKKKLQNLNKFKKFLKNNNHLSLDEMSHKWNNISFMTIYRAIKSLGYSYKKNSGYILSEMKKKELNI